MMNDKIIQWILGIVSSLVVLLVVGTVATYLDHRDLRKEFNASESHHEEYEDLVERVKIQNSQTWWRDNELRDHYNETRPADTEQVTWEGMPR